MEDKYVQQLIQNLIDRFEYLGESSFDLDHELKALAHPITREPLEPEIRKIIEKHLLERIQYKRSHDGAVLIPVSVVSDPRIHEEWYEDWIAKNNDLVGSYYWKRLEDFISRDLTGKHGPEKAGEIVRSIDEATLSIISKLANPSRKEFSYKGLVVGYVQSGKTANFTALIAKAADAGYKFIIVLSGIHSVLRRQTQVRLDRELTGMNDLKISDPFIAAPSEIKRWNRVTTARLKRSKSRDGGVRVADTGEFAMVNIEPFDSVCNRSSPTLAIVKKNVKVLEKLIEYIGESSENNRKNIPLLIIDDEADQASIDINAKDPDSDPAATNASIRKLLALLPRKAYVGYTATPFANVLIDMTTEHEELHDDLYPRNFIVSLPKPDGYFGTSLIFQGNLASKFVKEIPDEGNELINNGQMTDNLSEAIDQFILGCAVRNLRGAIKTPMSMLVHVTHKVVDMSAINKIVTGYVSDVKGRYGSKHHSASLKEQFEENWRDFAHNASGINRELNLDNMLPNFDKIWIEIGGVLKILKVVELNSKSEDRLDYTSGEEIKVIAIGGNQLSRGLTLEGLMTSYYLRSSKQYDTLLQMGRWFGYRQGYEDLTRIHTTEQIWGFFEHIALVEEELRSEIYRYEEDGKTPLEMAVAIRASSKLSITAPNKMGAFKTRQSSFSDSLNQTFWFPLEQPEILEANYNLGDNFVAKINKRCGFTNVDNSGVFLANNKLDGKVVLKDFLKRYTFVDKQSTGGPGLDSDSLLAYIERRLNDQNPELTKWSVAVVGNVNPVKDSGDPICFGSLPLNRKERSRKYTVTGFNIGVLTEKQHLTVDLKANQSRTPQNPLLLLYLIWKDSKAKEPCLSPQPDQRIDLYQFVKTEKVDVLGIAIALPKSKYEPENYIGQIIGP